MKRFTNTLIARAFSTRPAAEPPYLELQRDFVEPGEFY